MKTGKSQVHRASSVAYAPRLGVDGEVGLVGELSTDDDGLGWDVNVDLLEVRLSVRCLVMPAMSEAATIWLLYLSEFSSCHTSSKATIHSHIKQAVIEFTSKSTGQRRDSVCRGTTDAPEIGNGPGTQ
jgi:hypothetical protein